MNFKRTDSLAGYSSIKTINPFCHAILLSSLLLGACSSVPDNSSTPPVLQKEIPSSELKDEQVETPALKSDNTKEPRSIKAKPAIKNKEKKTTPTKESTPPNPKKQAKKVTTKKQKALDVVKKEKTPKPKKKRLKSKHSKKQQAKTENFKKETVKSEAPKSKFLDTNAPIIAFSLNKLPFSIGDNWEIDRSTEVSLNMPVNQSCALSYKALSMEDGQGITPILLTITADKVVVKTKSNIDLSYKNTGIAIDGSAQIPIEKLLNDFSIIYEQNYQSLIDTMQVGKQATISLGFWPTWPITRARSVQVELIDFPQAYLALQSCTALESKLK